MDLEDRLTIIWELHQSDKAQVRAQMGGSTGVKRVVIKRAGEEAKETRGVVEEALEANGKARKCSPPTMKSTWGMTGTSRLTQLMSRVLWIKKNLT